MRFAVLVLLFCALAACSSRPRPVRQGQSKDVQGRHVVWVQFAFPDSFVEEARYNGKLCWLKQARNQKAFDDSTFSQTDFFDNGKPCAEKAFYKGIPTGTWSSYYSTNKRKSWTLLLYGKLLSHTTFDERGKKNVSIQHFNSNMFLREEYYPNEQLFQEQLTDSLGNGTCTIYFSTGKQHSTGKLVRYEPSGLWNRWDSLGNPLLDTLYLFSK